ncbi:hypothetical protein ACIQU7_10790 [Streptomyces albidoflavus]
MSQQRKRRDRTVLRYQLPTVRTRLVDQLKVALAVGRHTGVFTSRQLEVPGVSDHRKGLVIAFLHSCGLLMRGGGRGVYRATPAARRMAEAWGRSEMLGRRELAIVLNSTWFAGIAREELGEHGGQRVALANRLLAAARAPETRRGEVEILIMWLLEARLLLPAGEGFIRWNADAHAAGPTEVVETAMTVELKEDVTGASGDNQDGRTDSTAPLGSTPPEPLHEYPHTTVSRAGIAEDEMLDSEDAPDAHAMPDGGYILRGDAVPPQTTRSAGTQSTQPTSQLTELAHLGELASQPIMLHELLQLSEEELLSMYRGLRRFIDVTAGAKGSSTKP